MNMWKVELVPIGSIRPSPFNPKERTDPKRLRDLKEDIRKHGLLYPIQVTADGEIIDGHRRYEVLKELGEEQIPVFRRSVNDSEEIFQSCNLTSERLSGAQWLQRWLQGGDVPKEKLNDIQLIEKCCGRDFLAKMAELHLSPNSCIDVARACMRYCDVPYEDLEFMRLTIIWLVSGRRQNLARRIMDSRSADSNLLFRAIIENRDLRITVTDAEGKS